MLYVQKEHFKADQRDLKAEHVQSSVNTKQLFPLKLLFVFLQKLKNTFIFF